MSYNEQPTCVDQHIYTSLFYPATETSFSDYPIDCKTEYQYDQSPEYLRQDSISSSTELESLNNCQFSSNTPYPYTNYDVNNNNTCADQNRNVYPQTDPFTQMMYTEGINTSPECLDEYLGDSDSSVEMDFIQFVDNKPPIKFNHPPAKPTTTKLPNFQQLTNRFLVKTSRRGRPVTYNKPGYTYRDSDDDSDDSLTSSFSTSTSPSRQRRGAKNILLWKFLLEELNNNSTYVQWINRREGTFKFVDTAECSRQWGLKKKKEDMNFEKLSRGIRHYYKDGLMSRLDGTRLVYKFNWTIVPSAFRKRIFCSA